MTRTRRQDAWQATVRISIPIDATKPDTIAKAQESVRGLAALIPGSAVEITHAGFGRMAAATVAAPPPPQLNLIADMGPVMADIKEQVLQAAPVSAGDDLEPPDSLRLQARQIGACR
jgi:hypothetical protein